MKLNISDSAAPPAPILYQCKVHVDNIGTRIEGILPSQFWDALSYVMSYEIPGAFFSSVYQRGHWDGRKKLFNKRSLTFPTGLFSLFRKICREQGVAFTILDKRQKPNHGPVLPIKDLTLFDYQEEAIKTCLQKQRGMIRLATGGGKTLLAAGLIANTNVPTVIFIHKQDIFHQLVDRLTSHLGIPIGKIGCGVVYPQNVTVCMIQTVHRAFGGSLKGMKDIDPDETVIPKPEIIKQCIQRAECVIIDESHHVSSAIFSEVLPLCEKAFYRWGLSATPIREDNADLLLDAHTGTRCVDISASELIRQGYLAKPTFYLFEFNHGRPTNTTYAAFYTQQVVQNIFRNKLIVQLALKAVSLNKTVLIAITRIEHGRILEAMLNEVLPGKVKFASGNIDSIERKQILKDLSDRKLPVVISTTVFGEGVDVASLDVLITAKAAQSRIDSLQLAGRALRITPTKKTATIIDIYDDHCKYLGKHAKARLNIYSTEPEFVIKKVKLLEQVTFL